MEAVLLPARAACFWRKATEPSSLAYRALAMCFAAFWSLFTPAVHALSVPLVKPYLPPAMTAAVLPEVSLMYFERGPLKA